MKENQIGTVVVDAAIAVRRELGPGLLESVYKAVLARELELRGLHVQRQVLVPIHYQDLQFDEGFRADLIVEEKVRQKGTGSEPSVPLDIKDGIPRGACPLLPRPPLPIESRSRPTCA